MPRATTSSVPPSVNEGARSFLSRAAWLALLCAAIAVTSGFALTLAWTTRERLQMLERELVKRQDASHEQATEARALAKQAEDIAHESATRVAVIEARVAESTLQRSQIEDLIQSWSRSRDENVLSDTEAAIRVAVQQSSITGSAEPLVAALRQADDRLARVNEPRLERVRRAVAKDLDRVRAAGVVDISTLTIRLDEATRMVDELPLLSAAQGPGAVSARDDAPARREAGTVRPRAASTPGAASVPQSQATGTLASQVSSAVPGSGTDALDLPAWVRPVMDAWARAGERLWVETRALIRVTRIAEPEAALIAPEQTFFLRENLKLRLLNARLALLSRQFDLAQADLREAQAMLDRYFDRSSRRVVASADLLRQAALQMKVVNVPRPDDTLAALTAAAAGH